MIPPDCETDQVQSGQCGESRECLELYKNVSKRKKQESKEDRHKEKGKKNGGMNQQGKKVRKQEKKE